MTALGLVIHKDVHHLCLNAFQILIQMHFIHGQSLSQGHCRQEMVVEKYPLKKKNKKVYEEQFSLWISIEVSSCSLAEWGGEEPQNAHSDIVCCARLERRRELVTLSLFINFCTYLAFTHFPLLALSHHSG